jgi:hypothetical protein
MPRATRFLLLWVGILAAETLAGEPLAGEEIESGSPPLTYELMINGESFLVEADQVVKLQSREKPGVTYEVALRIALEQPVRLTSFRFVYDWPAQVSETRRPYRMVRIQHELGYTMLIADLGRPLDSARQDETLKVVQESTVEGLQHAGMKEITVTDLPRHEFAGSVGHGVSIHCGDDKGIGHTSLVYVIAGQTFAGYCVVEYLDADQANVLPRVQKTLDSVQANPSAGEGNLGSREPEGRKRATENAQRQPAR